MSNTLIPLIPNKSKKDRTYFILFLSEGYSNKNEFNTHCKLIVNQLITIPPFNILKKHIEFYHFFTSSTIDGIPTGSPGNTAYRYFIDSDQLITEEPWLIAESIKGIKIKFNYTLPFIPFEIDRIWYNRAISKNRLIIVLAKNIQRIHNIVQWKYLSQLEDVIKVHYPGDHIEQLEKRECARAVFPVLAMTSWPWGLTGADEFHNPEEAAGFALAQYLGEILGLGFEYEKNGTEFDKLTIGDDEYLNYPNLFAYKLSENSVIPTSSDIEYLPWQSLIKARIDAGIVIENHPAATDTVNFKRIQGVMLKKVILLKHPDPSSANQALYNSLPAKYINRINSPNLIEGGIGFRQDVFRPNTDCLMRHDSITVTISGKKKSTLNPFCKVCRLFIRGRLGTVKNYIFRGISFNYNPYYPSLKPIDSKIAAKFAEHCENTYDTYSNNNYACVTASFRRFESFFINIINWKKVGEGFYKSNVKHDDDDEYMYYPKSPFIDYGLTPESKTYFHNLWFDNLKKQRDKRTMYCAQNYLAGSGAPGALEFLGFGTIYNHLEEVHTNGNTYYRYEKKTRNELLLYLDNLPKGTLLKLYLTHEEYDAVVRFVNGFITAQEVKNITNCDIVNGSPQVYGHSLIYMGKRDNGQHIIYDQMKNPIKSRTLEEKWDDLEYIIIGQWFDGENI